MGLGKCSFFIFFPFQFSSGIWYVTQKFATKSSCLTYEFKTDDLGFKSIEQVYITFYTNEQDLIILFIRYASCLLLTGYH